MPPPWLLRQCSGWAIYADLWRAIYEKADDIGIDLVQVGKVKAHRSIRRAEGMWDAMNILSNGRAEKLAKESVDKHPHNEQIYKRAAEQKLLVVENARYMARLCAAHFQVYPNEKLDPVPNQVPPPGVGHVLKIKHK